MAWEKSGCGLFALIPALLFAACTPGAAPPPILETAPLTRASTPDATPDTFTLRDTEVSIEGGSRPDEHGPPEAPRIDYILRFWAKTPCSGPLARVGVYYGAPRIGKAPDELRLQGRVGPIARPLKSVGSATAGGGGEDDDHGTRAD